MSFEKCNCSSCKPMKVKDLLSELENVDPDAELRILSVDSKGLFQFKQFIMNDYDHIVELNVFRN
jgi:hypothetical protein